MLEKQVKKKKTKTPSKKKSVKSLFNIKENVKSKPKKKVKTKPKKKPVIKKKSANDLFKDLDMFQIQRLSISRGFPTHAATKMILLPISMVSMA